MFSTLTSKFKPLGRWRSCIVALGIIFGTGCGLLAAYLLYLGPISPPPVPTAVPGRFPNNFLKGIAYESWWNGEFSTPESDQTLTQIIQPLGTNWIALIVKCNQASLNTTTIDCNTNDITATDDELAHAMHTAHQAGMKVMLKPHINLVDPNDATVGRHQINYGSDESKWQTWFANYTEMIIHYAKLAQDNGADYFVIGTELSATIGRDADWRKLIAEIRQIYHGLLTYASLTYFEPEEIGWWDALDSIGIDAYYALSISTTPTLAQLQLGWQPIATALEALSKHWQRPIIITELGYLSIDGAARAPGYWGLDGATDVQEQADCYQAFFDVFADKPWLQGVFWWSYSTKPDQGGPNDRTYTPHNKPAEKILRLYYGQRL
jgi:hypothetical protein